jgi:hypothetical protein
VEEFVSRLDLENLHDSEFEDCADEENEKTEKQKVQSSEKPEGLFVIPETQEMEKSKSFRAPRRKRTVMEMALTELP